MNNGPVITVGLPVFNGGRWLRQAANSILQQTVRDLVLVISDNASTDDTAAIGRSLAAADPRVRYVRQGANIGVYRNYDFVFRQCATPFFKWAAANDLCAPSFLERCIEVLQANDRAVLAAPRTIVFVDDPADGELYPWDSEYADLSPVRRFCRVMSELRLNNIFNGVIRSGALRTTGLNGVHWGSDIVLIAELALRGPLLLVNEPLFYRRMSPEATNSRRKAGDIAQFFSSERRDVLARPKWDFILHSLAAVRRAPLSGSERLQCAALIARMGWWARGEIARELFRAPRQAGVSYL